jgi:hypothetical protein
VRHYLSNISPVDAKVLLAHSGACDKEFFLGVLGVDILRDIREDQELDYHPLSDSFKAFGLYLVAVHTESHDYNGG